MSGQGNCWGRIWVNTFFSGSLFAILIPGFIVSIPPLILPKDPNHPKWFESTPVLPADPSQPTIYESLPGNLGKWFFTRRITALNIMVHAVIFMLVMFVFEIMMSALWERCPL